jgi:SEC-C motif
MEGCLWEFGQICFLTGHPAILIKVARVRKIGVNDPCWCGSGNKYKKCHLSRELDHPLPLGAVVRQTLAASKLAQCLHPLAARGVCDKIVSSHTIQRSRVLDRIVDSGNHVCTFFSGNGELFSGSPGPFRAGWKEASTFTGFCSKHDNAAFRALETADFDGSLEQCFLVGYRALCHEIHQKSQMLKSQSTLMSLIDRGLPEDAQLNMQHAGLAQGAGWRKGLEDFGRLKATMDQQLLARDYSGWHRAVITFKGPLSVASTGAVSPNRDLDGKPLQVLHDPDALVEELLFGIVATHGGGAAVFLCRENEKIPQAFVQCILSQERDWLASLIAQFAFAYIENTFFSKAWWDSLSNPNREHLASLAWVANAYYEPFTYSTSRRIVPWDVVEVAVSNS